MEVNQSALLYQPITIELKTRREAIALFGLVDKMENFRCNEGAELVLNDDEISLVVELSNINTNKQVTF